MTQYQNVLVLLAQMQLANSAFLENKQLMTINKLWIVIILACSSYSVNAFEYKGLYYRVNIENPSTVYLCSYQEAQGMRKIVIPETVEHNGKQYTVTRMEEEAFCNVMRAKLNEVVSVTIPKTITVIPKRAFTGCRSLMEVNLPSTIVAIQDEAFSGCKIKNLKLPRNLELIGFEAFSECRFTTVTIPASVKTLKSLAFYKNPFLQEVKIEDSPVELIVQSSSIFDGSPVKKAYLGRRIKIIDKRNGDSYITPFPQDNYDQLEELTISLPSLSSTSGSSSCEITRLRKLKHLYLMATNPPQIALESIFPQLFSQCEVCVPKGCKEKYEIDRFWGKFYKIVNGSEALVKYGEEERPGMKIVQDIVKIDNTTATTEEEVFEVVDYGASFPGGDGEMIKWIQQKMKYPTEAEENGESGRVVVKFIVDVDGTILNPIITKSVSPSIDKEAKRVVRNMPKWTPARKNGVRVKSYYTTSINFILTKQKN